MRIFQIYQEFRIFDLPDIFFSGYGHRHISGSLNLLQIIFRILFGQAILIYGEHTIRKLRIIVYLFERSVSEWSV